MDSSMATKPLPGQTLPMQTLTVTDSSMERKQLPGQTRHWLTQTVTDLETAGS
jgi:hypothetical protein